MPAKDEMIKKEIEKSIGFSRKGRKKVIKLVQKNNPANQIHNVNLLRGIHKTLFYYLHY